MTTNSSVTTLEGVVLESLPNAMFRVRVDGEKLILCHLAGKMRMNHVRLLPGDRVKVEMTPYDTDRGRVVYKLK